MILQFMSGALMMASFVAALFFLRFWKSSQDKLFKKFAMAFFLLGVERIVMIFVNAREETSSYVFLLRLSAFLILLFGIYEKNYAGKRTERRPAGPLAHPLESEA